MMTTTQENTGQELARNTEEAGLSALQTKLEGKYMTFKLADEEYGLEILKVREIIGLMSVTKVPRAADFIRGVINLRGKVIPVLDLRLKFGMDKTPDTDRYRRLRVPSGEDNAVVIALMSETGELKNGVRLWGFHGE